MNIERYKVIWRTADGKMHFGTTLMTLREAENTVYLLKRGKNVVAAFYRKVS